MSNSPSAGGASWAGAAVWSSVGAAAGACAGSILDSLGPSAGASAGAPVLPSPQRSHREEAI